MSKLPSGSASASTNIPASASTTKFLFDVNSPSDRDSDTFSDFSFNVYSDSVSCSDSDLVLTLVGMSSDSEKNITSIHPDAASALDVQAQVSASASDVQASASDVQASASEVLHASGVEASHVHASPQHWEKFLCPCEEQNLRNALQQNANIPSSESDFEDFGSISSSSYTSSAELSDQPYEPHRGRYTHDYPLTASETEKFPSSEKEGEENDETQEEEKKESNATTPPTFKHLKGKPITSTPLSVLKLPDWRDNWSIQVGNSTMRRVTNPIKVRFLQNFKNSLLTQESVLFKEIPQFDDKYFGTYRFLVTKKTVNAIRVFVVVPNVVIGGTDEEDAELLFLAPSKEWYQLQPGRGRENEYYIPRPAPLSKTQTLSTLLLMNFI